MSLQAQPETQQNGAIQMGKPRQNEQAAVLYLTPMNGTFERKTINVPFYPDVLRIGRQTNNKTVPTPTNGFFDSKVLSRQHAEIWADRNGKIWIRDVKSSNGTFVNGQRLSQENKDSDPHELREQDMLELGIDIVSEDQKTVVHHKVAARVEHAGFYEPNSVMDLNFGDFDASATSNLAGASLGQPMGQVRRSNSNTSLNSNGRMSIVSAASNVSNIQQRAPHFWLAPVNMDKIIQKLNVSLTTMSIIYRY
jgi:pSer/pThr/pTyr-binding forkhead associated (FHA) protein